MQKALLSTIVYVIVIVLGVQELTRSGLNGVLGEGFLKDDFPFFRLIKVLYLRGENCLQNAHFYKKWARPYLKRTLNWTGSIFSTPDFNLTTKNHISKRFFYVCNVFVEDSTPLHLPLRCSEQQGAGDHDANCFLPAAALAQKRCLPSMGTSAARASIRWHHHGVALGLANIGHPQTCVYPDVCVCVCLGIAHVSGNIPLLGQGVR